MNIVEMKLSELKPYDNNPRHNDVAVQPVANSIREFGFKVPIVVDAMGDKHMRMHHRVNWDCCTPKILNERWKKSKGG